MTLRTLSPLLVVCALAGPVSAEDFTKIPAPALDAPADAATETVVLAGGCFWGVQGVFQHVKGVTRAVSGYAGGMMSNAEYEKVSNGNTGHAESVQVTYDPKQISYGKILQIYFSVAHDPTQLNRQGPDTGTQYRSAIFPANDQQAAVAKAYITQLNQARVYKSAIVTKLETGKAFYPAEKYHQDYLTLHPKEQYIAYNDIPKVQELQKMYPDTYRADPVLVSKTGIK
jgi:peptide-methionine (S)-S-oxide reductase